MAATPQAKADVDPSCQTQVTALRELNAANAQAMLNGGQVQWSRPSGWAGELTDWEGLAVPFSRKVSNDSFEASISDANSPGCTGDMLSTATQVDWLANLELAARSRYAMSWPRSLLHAAAVMAGNGVPQGAVTMCVLEYVRRLVAQTKGGVQA